MHFMKTLACLLLLSLPAPAWAQTYLHMAGEHGRYWCAEWNITIAPIYPKTAEGRTLPLKHSNIHDQTPNVIFTRPVHYTPAFIIIQDRKEAARIEGYPGEDFFWGMLVMLIQRVCVPLHQ